MGQEGWWTCPVCGFMNRTGENTCWFCKYNEYDWKELDDELDDRNYQ